MISSIHRHGGKVLIGGLVLLVVILTILQIPPRYNLTGVDPTLRGFAMPYQSVNLVNGSDGSIGIRILDRDGRQLKLALPVSSAPNKLNYHRLFVGADRSDNPSAVEAPFSEDTRGLLVATMEGYRKFSDSTDITLLRFRGSFGDKVRWYSKNVLHIIKRAN
jgi:hypothetical protein